MHRVVAGLQFFPAHVVQPRLGLEFHLIQARWEALDDIQRCHQLVVLLAGNVPADKNAQVSHAVVQHINNGAPGCGNRALVAPGVHDPVQRLRWWRDVVAPGGEHHHGRGDVAQVDGLITRHDRAASQLVADKQVLHNTFNFAAGHAEKTTPPALEFQKPLRLCVDVAPQVVVLVPEGVGRVEFLEIFHQVHTVKAVGTQVCGHGGQPRSAQRATRVAHGVEFAAARPVRHGRAHDHQRTKQFRPHSVERHHGPASLAIADHHRADTAFWMAGDHRFNKTGLGVHHRPQGLSLFGFWPERDEIHRVACTHGHANLGVELEAANAWPVSSPGVYHDDRPSQRVGGQVFRWHQAQQGVVAGFRQVMTVQHDFVLKLQQRWCALVKVFQVVVAPVQQGVKKQEGTLDRIREIVIGADRRFERRPGR